LGCLTAHSAIAAAMRAAPKPFGRSATRVYNLSDHHIEDYGWMTGNFMVGNADRCRRSTFAWRERPFMLAVVLRDYPGFRSIPLDGQ
jgi:hypothetical protein